MKKSEIKIGMRVAYQDKKNPDLFTAGTVKSVNATRVVVYTDHSGLRWYKPENLEPLSRSGGVK